jgi:oxalate---CoA ligase
MPDEICDSALGRVSPAAAEPLTALLAHPDPGCPALIVPDSGQVLTHGQLATRVEMLARRLAGLGVNRGDRVALALPNGPDIVLLLLAITALGAAAAPLNPAYTESEFGFYLGDISPRLMLVPASGVAAASGAADAAGTTVVTVTPVDDGPPELRTSSADGLTRSFEPGGPDDVAFVLHTSGTTSRPKQVPLLQRNLMATVRTIGAHYQLGASDVSFCVMPLFHIHGLVASTFAALGAGGAVITPRRFTPHRFWAQAREQPGCRQVPRCTR